MWNTMKSANEAVAVWLTKAFGTMWLCYAFMIYGLLPVFAIFHRHEAAFLYWSNWIQLWSLPLILVGTNILGRAAEARSKLDHEKLAKSYEEQLDTYRQVMAMLGTQSDMMADMLRQDRTLEAQNIVLAEQTSLMKRELRQSGIDDAEPSGASSSSAVVSAGGS